VVEACRVGREVACEEGWRTACRDNQDAGGVAGADVEVAGAEDVAVGGVAVADAVDIAAVVVAGVAEGAGRMDACWDSSVGRQRQSEVPACKTGQDRWNIQRQKQIAIESGSGVTVPATAKGDGRGRNGPTRCGLACLRRRIDGGSWWRKRAGTRESQREGQRQVLRRPDVEMEEV
jgi:hypothetical protein